MDQTPRLRSAFPATPQPSRRQAQFNGSPGENKRRNAPIPTIPTVDASQKRSSDPLIPERILDAPTQRLFAVSTAVALWTWRLYDWQTLFESEEQSLWLFMKWVAIDGVFLFGLPGLRIPWLEWSAPLVLLLFCFHAVLNAILMFRIPIPILPAFALLGRSLWGAYELAVNEHSVNPAAVRLNESLILGRQVIHVLPEGSAILNPDKEVYCIDASRPEARLPITINSTRPISIELLRTDLDTESNDTIQIGKSQIKTMHKEASRLPSYSDKEYEPKTLYYPVKKPGLYLLSKVIDDSNLEVSRKRLAHTIVVPCPKAEIKPSGQDQCKGELSDVEIVVTGTPPLTLTYRKIVNRAATSAILENILPDDFVSPLARQDQSALIVPGRVDTAWVRTRQITMPLSESLGTAGHWMYSVQDVRDAFGNTIIYAKKGQEDQERYLKMTQLHRGITVHERPTVTLQGCSPQDPLKVAKGKKATLPLRFGSTGRTEPNETYDLDYNFSPEVDLDASSSQVAEVKRLSFTGINSNGKQEIQDPGSYSLTSVRTKFCKGEVLEPASCILQNPPQPQLSLAKEEIFDKCAGSPIGLRLALDLVGTPPFKLFYRMTRLGDEKPTRFETDILGLRKQIELTPKQAGHFRYEFMEISDAVYGKQKLSGLVLEQDVKPSASASFLGAKDKKIACIDDTASFEVSIRGERPFTIEYEIIHNGRRSKFEVDNIEQDVLPITTPVLSEGGDYTVALMSVTDRMGCKEFLKDEARISVRHRRPQVGFKDIENKRSISLLEGDSVELPLKLEGGEGRWTIKYVDPAGRDHTVDVQQGSDRIKVNGAGRYQLTDVRDGTCPGVVDEPAKEFEVEWISRPELRISSSNIVERKGSTIVKADVCEGDVDALEVLFKGLQPFEVDYELQIRPTKGTISPKNKKLRAAQSVASLRMDTSFAGTVEYNFNTLEDGNYKQNSKHFTPISVQQRVHARPSVAFAKPGATYGFCSTETDKEEDIPIKLVGQPPFDVELEIKHGATGPEVISLTGITGLNHDVRIPQGRLQRGKSIVSLRRVSDSNGCIRVLDSTTPTVQITVSDAPTITPLEAQTDYCVGDRINFALSGVAPFTVFYTFEGTERKAKADSGTFRRLAEKPGVLVITKVEDGANQCAAVTNISKVIHGLPSARVSSGRETYVDIHEGGEAEILFEFGGVPPFEFTYTRSSNTDRYGKKAGRLLDMRSERSEEHSMRIRAHEEGTYEVVAIKDRHCSYTKPGVKFDQTSSQKRLAL